MCSCFAAGNSGSSVSFPATVNGVIAVGAVDKMVLCVLIVQEVQKLIWLHLLVPWIIQGIFAHWI